jgi:UDP-N-acetylglucosamine transferase subunit ALG13
MYSESQEENAPNASDVARADLYKTSVVVAHASEGSGLTFFHANKRLLLIY